MHPINKALYQLGLMLQRTRPRTFIPFSFHRNYLDGLRALRRDARGFRVYLEERYEVGMHPDSFIDQECSFASYHLQRTRARRILDVGSYRL